MAQLIQSEPRESDAILTCRTHDNTLRWREGDRLERLFEERCDRFAAEGRPDHPAVASPDGTLGFAGLDALANRLAHYLADHGVGPGDRVAVLLDRSARTYAVLLAILKLGAAYVPLDCGFPRNRIEFILEDAEVKAVVTLEALQGHVEGAAVPQLLLDRDEAHIARCSDRRPAGDDDGSTALCYIVYTSGSTGKPKGVEIEHPSICNFVKVAGEVYGVGPSDRMYQGMTLAFDFSVEELWVPLIAGATLVPGRSDGNLVGDELAQHLLDHGVTAICCVPTLLATIEHELPDLRFVLVSGEACPRDLVSRWHRPGRTMLNAYGPTEATVTASWTELHPDRPVTIGQPLPTYSVVILDENADRLLERGALGEICIGGIGLARGYVHRDDLTRKVFIDDFVGLPDNPSERIYRTGDLGRINDDGEIEFHGRIDTQVKIRGYRIELTEIESALLRLPAIAQAVVNVWSPEPGAQELVAYYTLRNGGPAPAGREIAEALRAFLPAYMVPAWYEQLRAIPMLPSNKADRKNLPEPRSSRCLATAACHVAPENETEEILAECLAHVLKLDRVSTTDHFFEDLGAHSLLMAQFGTAVRKRLPGADVAMRDLYQHPTIRRLAAHMQVSGRETASPVAESYRVPSNLEYYGCGTLQLLSYVGFAGLNAWVLHEALLWVTAGGGALDLYVRSVIFSTLWLTAACAVPVAAKWTLIGRARPERIPLWGLRYYRFWLVRQLVRACPLVVFKGTPIYNAYLRLLGCRIGRDVVIETKTVPLGYDLLTIGDRTILRKDSLALGYKAQGGYLVTGPISIGADAFVGLASVLDVGTTMQDGARLAHASSLQTGQVVPAGRSYHGSPAEEARVHYGALEAGRIPLWTKVSYTAGQLASLLLVYLPLPLALALFHFPHTTDHPVWTGRWVVDLAAVSFVLFLGALALRLLIAVTVPRLLNPLLDENRIYPLYGFHYVVAKSIETASNSWLLNLVFGDSSYIVHYLKMLGYDLGRVVQTGSNFGVSQKHENPLRCSVGGGTMVADGLSMVNVEMSGTSFRVRRVAVGPRNYLGNEIYYPPDGKTGENCLLATKLMVPIDGPVRRDVGLLGSPCFEIPRVVERDAQATPYDDEATRRAALRRKNRHNLQTMGGFLLSQWGVVFLLLCVAGAAADYDDHHGPLAWAVGLFSVFPVLVVYHLLVEWAALRFRHLQPRCVSMYDREFWRVERYWKLNESFLGALFKGTPFRTVIARLHGVRFGRKVFDDGATATEKTLTTVGDYCTLNESALLQCHSLEEGLFKSDRTVLGQGCTVGPAALVHYGVRTGDNVVVAPDAFVMKGEAPEANSYWVGNPARARPRGAGHRT